MPNDVVKRLVYRGPALQVCYQLTEYGYSAVLVPDKLYELPTEFADALLRSNVNFQVAPPSGFSFQAGRSSAASSATSSEQENK